MADKEAIAVLATPVLTAVVVLAAWFDLRQRRIPNVIVFPAIFMGLIFNSLTRGWEGLWFGGRGLMIGFALLFLPYLLGAMGAGDVKFLAAIGTFVGGYGAVRIILLTLLAYPVLAVSFVIQQRKVRLTLKRFIRLCSKLIGVIIPALRDYATYLESDDDGSIPSATSPFGLAICAGTIIAQYTNILR